MLATSSLAARLAISTALCLMTLSTGPALASGNAPVVQCNNGALVVSRVADLGTQARYEAEIRDPGVVAYILDESTKDTKPNISGYDWDGWVQKGLPRTVTVSTTPQGTTLLISELYASDFGDGSGFASSQYLPMLRPANGGLRVEITNSKMLGSHTNAFWEVANWFFETCSPIAP